ncbi:hypothetical protein Ocin01_05476, partial [Orchesella cincta]
YNAWRARLAAERLVAATQRLAGIHSGRNSVSVPVVPGCSTFQTATTGRQKQRNDPQFDQIEKDLRAMHEDTVSGYDKEVVILNNGLEQQKKDGNRNRPTSISPLFPQGLLGGRGSNFGSLDDIIAALDVNNHELTTYELIWGKAPSPVRVQFTSSPISASQPSKMFRKSPSPPELSPQKPLGLSILLQHQFSPPAPTLQEEMSRFFQPIMSPPLGKMVSPANVLPQIIKRRATPSSVAKETENGSTSSGSSSPFPAASEILAMLETEVGGEKSPNAPTNKEKYDDNSLDLSFLDDSQSESDSKPEEGRELYPQLKSQLMKAKLEKTGPASPLLPFSELVTRSSNQHPSVTSKTEDSSWLPSFQSLNKRPVSAQSTFREVVGSDGKRRYIIDGENPFKGPSPKKGLIAEDESDDDSDDSDSDSDTVTVYIQPAKLPTGPKKSRGPALERLIQLKEQLNSARATHPTTTRFTDLLAAQRASKMMTNLVSSPKEINSGPYLPPVENQSQHMPPSQPGQLSSNLLRRIPVISHFQQQNMATGLGSTSPVGTSTPQLGPPNSLITPLQSHNPQFLNPSVAATRELQSPGPNVMSQPPRGYPNEISSFLHSIHGGSSAAHSQSPTFKMPLPVNNYTRQKSVEEQTQSPQSTAAPPPPTPPSILRQSIMSPQRSRQSPYPFDYPTERAVNPIPIRGMLTPISQGARPPPPQYQQQPYYTHSHSPFPSPQIRYGLPQSSAPPPPPQYSSPISPSPLSYMPTPPASPLPRVRTPRATRTAAVAAAGSRSPYGSRSITQTTPQSPGAYSHKPYPYRQPTYPYYGMSPQTPPYTPVQPLQGRSDTPYHPNMSYHHAPQSPMYHNPNQSWPNAPSLTSQRHVPVQNTLSYPFRPTSAMDMRQMDRPSSVAEIRHGTHRPSSTAPLLTSSIREGENVTYTTLQPPRPTRIASQPAHGQLVRNPNPSIGPQYPYQTNIPAHGPNHNLLLNLKGSQHLGRARQSTHPYANTEKYGVATGGKGRSYTPTTPPQQQQSPFFQTLQQQQQQQQPQPPPYQQTRPPPYQPSPASLQGGASTSYGSNIGQQQFYSEGKSQPQRPFSNLGPQSRASPSPQLFRQNSRAQHQHPYVYSNTANYAGAAQGGSVGSGPSTPGYSGSIEGPGGRGSQNSIRVGPGASASGFALPNLDRGAARVPAVSTQQNASRRQQAVQFSGGQVHNVNHGYQQGGSQHLSNADAGNTNHYIGGVQSKTGWGSERLGSTIGRGGNAESAPAANTPRGVGADPASASPLPQTYSHQRQQVSHHGRALPVYPQPQYDANSRRMLNHTPSNENWQFENDAVVLPGNIQRTEEELWKRQESEAHNQLGSKTPTSNSGNVLGSAPLQPTSSSSSFQQSDTGSAQFSVPTPHSSNTAADWTATAEHYGQPTAHSSASSNDRGLYTLPTSSSMVQTSSNQETVYGSHAANRLPFHANNYQLSSIPRSGASSQASSPTSPAFPAANVHSHGSYIGGDTRDSPQRSKIAEKVPKTKQQDSRLYWDD